MRRRAHAGTSARRHVTGEGEGPYRAQGTAGSLWLDYGANKKADSALGGQRRWKTLEIA